MVTVKITNLRVWGFISAAETPAWQAQDPKFDLWSHKYKKYKK